MKVAVTGATGFVGRHLVKRLLADGHQITAVIHRTHPEWLRSSDVEARSASVSDLSSLSSAFAGAEVVYHLVGIIAETRQNTFNGTVAEGTKKVAAACGKAGVGRLIYLSAMGTSAEAPAKYHKAKFAAEEAVINSGLNYVILRPSVIYGPGDGFVSLLSQMIRLTPVVPVIGTGKYQLQPVFIDDLMAVMAGCLSTEEAWGEIIDVGGPQKLEFLEILSIIGSALHRKRMNFFVPTVVAKAAATVLEHIMKPAPLTVDQLTMMEAGSTGDIEKMKKLFDLQPIDMKNGLSKYLE